MKTEISAGGVIVKNNRVLLLRDMNDSWTFPKGVVEKGETKRQGALREIAEEVGLRKLEYIATISPISYTYRRGSLIHKTVHYFLFRAIGSEKIVCQKSEGIKEAKWFDFEQALSIIGYPKTNMPLLKKAQTLV